ncbi:MAG: LytTR family transcriptional regulator DNA-binding domain-containing protein, partial [Sinomicrobium sp.]|nr:LytTR family transcriptional regulator DNA-binding domain-containing protein [Sinomicrobium sp.]
IPYRSDYAIVNIEDIITIEAERMYSKLLVTYPRKKTTRNYLYAKKLSYFENLFEELSHFYRVHRSWIVNTRHIHTYSKQDRRITLDNGMEIPVSKTQKHAFEAFLGF